MEREFDVLVVGAGPTGCTAAERLARQGWRVAVFEEHQQVGDPVNCSGVISVEAFHRYQLPEGLIRHTLKKVRFRSPGGISWSFDAGRPMAHAVDRTKLDQLLAKRAEDSGAIFFLGHRVDDVVSAGGILAAHVRTNDGQVLRFQTRAAVLATGAGVPLLRKLGWESDYAQLLGVQTELLIDGDNVEIYLGKKVAPEGFAWMIPLGGGMGKVGLLCRQDGPYHLRRFLQHSDLRSRIHGEPGPILCSVLPLGFLPKSYSDRILVVGEAAGHIKATTCGGIYYGMLTAGIASEVLDRALEDDHLDANSLSIYEDKWRRLLQEEIEVGLKLRRIFHFLSDFHLDSLVALASRDGIFKLIQEKVDFDWHRELIRSVLRHSTVTRILGLA